MRIIIKWAVFPPGIIKITVDGNLYGKFVQKLRCGAGSVGVTANIIARRDEKANAGRIEVNLKDVDDERSGSRVQFTAVSYALKHGLVVDGGWQWAMGIPEKVGENDP